MESWTVLFSHINPEIRRPHCIYSYWFRDQLAFTEYIIASFIEKHQWTAWKLFYDDHSYPQQETKTCYILLKDMPAIEAIKSYNGTHIPGKISECDLQKNNPN